MTACCPGSGDEEKEDLPMCSSMKVLSVRGTLLVPILACPRFRMSSRTDFKLGNLNIGEVEERRKRQARSIHIMDNSSLLKTWHSPPRHVGFHHLQHAHRGLVNFDKGAAEDLPQPQHVDDLRDLGTDTFNPGEQDIVRDYWQR